MLHKSAQVLLLSYVWSGKLSIIPGCLVRTGRIGDRLRAVSRFAARPLFFAATRFLPLRMTPTVVMRDSHAPCDAAHKRVGLSQSLTNARPRDAGPDFRARFRARRG